MATTLRIVNGDVDISPASGQPNLVSGMDMTRQILEECLQIETLPNGFGAGIVALVGTTDVPEAVRFMAEQKISTAIESWQQLQNKSDVPFAQPERITGVTSIIVVQHPNKTDFEYRVDVSTAAGVAAVTTGVAQ